MFYNFIVLGGFWFWALIIAFVIAEISYVHHENPLGAGFLIILLGGILLAFSSLKTFFVYCYSNPGQTASVIGIYLVIGVLWSIFKWFRFVKKTTKEFNKVKVKTLEKHGVSSVSALPSCKDGKTGSWEKRDPKEWLETEYKIRKSRCSPSEGKDRITTWILYWAFSMFWDVFETITIRLIDNIYKMVKSVYLKITKKLFRDLDADFEQVK